ncbi:hypothetical protein SAMN05519103_03238 [Rhizobiales bacterium GAS113]|nr:hypothetical protein SAMN05519103_03238 [Rhizobiales bacterium GAS113]
MRKDRSENSMHGDYIARALATDGGHLTIGRGGFSLHFARGATLSGYDCETIKAACIAASLPVIDSRTVEFAVVARLAVSGPLIAVGEAASAPPYHALSYAPLAVVAASYRDAGAEVWNLSPAGEPGE